MAKKEKAIGISEHMRIGLHGQPFDIRGVREVEDTRDLSNKKPPHGKELTKLKRKAVAALGKDLDGAYRLSDRLDQRR